MEEKYIENIRKRRRQNVNKETIVDCPMVTVDVIRGAISCNPGTTRGSVLVWCTTEGQRQPAKKLARHHPAAQKANILDNTMMGLLQI